MAILKVLANNPRYALMRGVARFAPMRWSVARLKGVLQITAAARYERDLVARMPTTVFAGVDRQTLLDELRARGCGFGLQLPAGIVTAVRQYADTHPVFAFRNEKYGFHPAERDRAELALHKEILLAQYYNSETECRAIGEVAADPLLNWIALKYLGSVPKFLGVNLWWTYPIRPTREDQLKHAHFFHRDVDDFRFLKFFFYLTEVESGDGAHWLVSGSHRKPPYIRFKDRFLLRRFEDPEIESFYDPAAVLEVVGGPGLGFAEDTLCVHKAASPSRKPRLILQLQFALFDFENASDRRDPTQLQMI
jgi:hypothetical protein